MRNVLGELGGLLELSDLAPHEDNDSSSESHLVNASQSEPDGIGKHSDDHTADKEDSLRQCKDWVDVGSVEPSFTHVHGPDSDSHLRF